jgi:hypothetical protein
LRRHRGFRRDNWAYAVLGLGVSDDRFGETAAQLDGVGDAPSLAGDKDLKHNHPRALWSLLETPQPSVSYKLSIRHLAVPYVLNPDIPLTGRRVTGRVMSPRCEHVSLRLDLIGVCAATARLRTRVRDGGCGS